jgi:DNA-binding NtrC family response regulator
VRAHRGAIQVTTAPGAGSTFHVLLPAHASSARTTAGENVRPAVLVVDDEEVVRLLAAASLEREGYEVLTAANGGDALALLRSEGGRVRLVILDLTLPGTSGADILPKLREIRPDLDVIISSGYGGADISGFIQKPYTVQRLAEKVKSVLS